MTKFWLRMISVRKECIFHIISVRNYYFEYIRLTNKKFRKKVFSQKSSFRYFRSIRKLEEIHKPNTAYCYRKKITTVHIYTYSSTHTLNDCMFPCVFGLFWCIYIYDRSVSRLCSSSWNCTRNRDGKCISVSVFHSLLSGSLFGNFFSSSALKLEKNQKKNRKDLRLYHTRRNGKMDKCDLVQQLIQ